MRREKGQVHALRHLKVTASVRVPRVTVDRINSASTIFHVGRTAFAPGCGLWFGVQWQRADATVADGNSLPMRSRSRWAYSATTAWAVSAQPVTAASPLSPAMRSTCRRCFPDSPALLLSRYHPRPTELPVSLADPRSAYSLTAVAGWLRSPDGAAQRRKRLHLVQEGSIICPPGYPAGDVANVKPDYDETAGELPHDVYRYGLALAVDASTYRRQTMPDYVTYDVTLSLLTPMHIGNGRELLNEYDYAIHKGKTWRINEDTLLDEQDVDDPRLAEQFAPSPKIC